jgi:hypothetical protein
MKAPGRNEPCPCGSDQKYKHCCGRLALNRPERMAAAVHAATLREKNIALLNAAAEIFAFNRPWDTIKRKISGAQVREFYEFVAHLWPLSTDVMSMLPEPGSSLRALYLGEYAPELIVENVFLHGFATRTAHPSEDLAKN